MKQAHSVSVTLKSINSSSIKFIMNTTLHIIQTHCLLSTILIIDCVKITWSLLYHSFLVLLCLRDYWPIIDTTSIKKKRFSKFFSLSHVYSFCRLIILNFSLHHQLWDDRKSFLLLFSTFLHSNCKTIKRKDYFTPWNNQNPLMYRGFRTANLSLSTIFK